MDIKMTSLNDLIKVYKAWVRSNPNVATDAETVVTWSSYFIVGKINKSPIVSEFVYSLSKLLSLYNDRLIRETYGSEPHIYSMREKIKIWLTVVHYCEVFIELVIRNKWGNNGKWTIATLIQLLKCSANLTLLYKFRAMPIQHPPVPSLHRKKFIESQDIHENQNEYYTLKRSGRVIRRVDGAPPVAFRDWQPVKAKSEPQDPRINIKDLLYAETIHAIKPLIHLASMRLFGTTDWKQWMVSLSLDLASLKLYSKYMKDLSYDQRLEVSRRKLALLLYLLRSPMYSRFTKDIIERGLTSTSKKIPMTSFICSPILQYLSHWQDIYFYMWAS